MKTSPTTTRSRVAVVLVAAAAVAVGIGAAVAADAARGTAPRDPAEVRTPTAALIEFAEANDLTGLSPASLRPIGERD